MPLLSRFLALQQASPLAALTQPQTTPQMGFEWQNPSMLPQAPQVPQGAAAFTPNKQATPGEGTPPGGWMSRLQSGMESPLFNIGMALMAGSQNGGDWGVVSDTLRGYGQDQRERQRLENEQRRQKAQDAQTNTLFARQQTQWGREDQQIADWERALQNETDPQRQAQLRAIGPQGYGGWLQDEARMRFQSHEAQLDRDAAERAARIRSANENSLGRYFQSMDAQTLGELNQTAAQLQSVGLPQLRALRQTIERAGSSLTGQPIDYNTRITLGRYFNGSSSDRQSMEVWRAQILGPALETLRGLGAMSEREMEAAVNSFSNPNMTMGAAMQLIDEKIATAERRVATAQAAGRYFREAQGLTGVTNSAGQDWPTYLQSQLGAPVASTMPNGAPPPPSVGASATTQQSNVPPPPQRGQIVNGFRFMGGDPADRRNWVRINGGSTPQAARGNRPGAF